MAIFRDFEPGVRRVQPMMQSCSGLLWRWLHRIFSTLIQRKALICQISG
jgi:hypothetical protein